MYCCQKKTLIRFVLIPLTVVKIIVKVESRECEILKTAFKMESACHDVTSGGEGRGGEKS